MASGGILTSQILRDLEISINAAWNPGAVVFPISIADPRLPIGPVGVSGPNGYAVIDPAAVEQSFSGAAASVGVLNQQNSFDIHGRFPWPEDPTILIVDEQVAKVNAFIGQVQAGANFGTGGYGLLPIVTMVDITERGDPNEQMYMVSLSVSIVTRSSHH